jgi:glycosyltransferase involved in cell wall biosynthesis/SAM-dependent methyltransferase
MMENSWTPEIAVPTQSISNVDRTCILVLGMHRSGTSAVTRVVNLLGADLASDLMPTLPENARGYWESCELMGIHDELLACGSSRWDDWRPFTVPPQSHGCQQHALDRLRGWLDREFGASRLFAVKDPRICRFVPLWLATLQAFGCQPRAVLPVRHPFEVAASLHARDGITFTKGCLLWLRHVVDAERTTRHIPRAWVHYNGLLEDWVSVTAQVGQRLGVEWPRSVEDAAGEVSNFLTSELRHHVASPEELTLRSDVVGWVRRTYAAVTGLIAEGEAEAFWRELDQVRAEFDNACLAFGELIHAEREESAQHALAHMTVVTREEFDRRVVGIESRLARYEAFFEDDEPGSAEPSEGQDARLNVKGIGRHLGSVTARLDATLGTVDDLSAKIAGQEARVVRSGDELAACQSRVDGLASMMQEHQNVTGRLEDELSTLAASHHDATSRIEAEVANVASEHRNVTSRIEAEVTTLASELRTTTSRIESDVATLASEHRRTTSRIESDVATLASEHRATTSRIEESFTTLASEQQAVASRLEGEIAGWATSVERLLGQVSSQEALSDALHQETRRLAEIAGRLTESSSEHETSTAGQFTHVRSDLDAVRTGIAEMRLLLGDTRARLDRLHDELEKVRQRSLGHRWRRVRAIAKPVERALRRVRKVVVGLVTFQWLRMSRHDFRLPFYRKQLLATGLFDPQWYLERNPDVAAAGMDPLDHWLSYGAREGRDPNPEFDTDWYLERYPHVAESGQNPLVHYLRRGSSPGIDPSPRFDGARYLSQHPDVARAGLNPLVHYLKHRVAHDEGGMVESIPFEPLVTVVVPNFNHADYLRRRLDSIYNQTYRNFRVMLLDDCSSDTSRAILEEYRAKYPDITTCHFNEKNSGGVFRQWRKAIHLASGSPLLWIAESDDYCDHDFLEKLVPFFRDEAVMLAYSRVQFVNQEGVPNSFTFRDHVSPHMDASKWSRDYVEASHREVESALAIKNTIPNVSGAVLRTPSPDLCLLEDESWLNMKVCGDWVLYLHLLAGGRVAYCARTTNYFRFHSSNSSGGKTHKDDLYYREHARVSEEAARLYGVSNRTLDLAREVTRKYYRTMTGGGGDEFDQLFDAKRIAQAKAHRNPTVMISIFSFVTGGGEIIPIRLANELKRRGCPVVVHCFDYQQDEPGVRAMLRSDIPVVRAHTGEQIVKMLADVAPEIINTHHQTIQHKFLELTQERPEAFDAVRHVATMHGMFEGLPDEYLDSMLPAFVKTVDGWIYTADKNIKPFQDRGLVEHASFTKLPNGMERPKLRRMERAELGIEADAFVLCEVSRAIPEKGWREAIDAVTQARRKCARPIHLLLLGTGPVFDELSRQSLPPYVQLLGFTDDACSYYAMSDMAILPSTFSGESFPMTLVEAILVEKPVIATDVGEIRAMITSESGVAGVVLPVVKGKVSVDQISEQIVRFAQNAEAYEQACVATRALAERYDVRKVAEQYLQTFASTTKRSTQRPRVPAEPLTPPPLLVQAEQLRDMKLFDEDFYRQQYPDIAQIQDPLGHYVLHGFREQRMPNDWFDFQYIRQSCQEIDHQGVNPLWYYGTFLKDSGIKTRSDMRRWGYCPVCERRRLFLAHFDTEDSFNNLRCIACNGAPRDRAVAVLLDELLPGWRKKASVHESSPCTPCLKMLAGDYSASQYYPDKRPGSMVKGFRNENIEKLTFKDNSFDIVAALEVIEHVFNPEDMVREMVRCTKPGGIAVFTTVPGGIPISRPRARLDEKTGEVEHFFPPVYHGNPIGDGALLTWDFGLDFDDNIREWSGGAELTHWCEADEKLGIIPGGIPHIYLLKKPAA